MSPTDDGHAPRKIKVLMILPNLSYCLTVTSVEYPAGVPAAGLLKFPIILFIEFDHAANASRTAKFSSLMIVIFHSGNTRSPGYFNDLPKYLISIVPTFAGGIDAARAIYVIN